MSDKILCGLCRERPVNEGGQMCKECRERVEARNANPYANLPDRAPTDPQD